MFALASPADQNRRDKRSPRPMVKKKNGGSSVGGLMSKGQAAMAAARCSGAAKAATVGSDAVSGVNTEANFVLSACAAIRSRSFGLNGDGLSSRVAMPTSSPGLTLA